MSKLIPNKVYDITSVGPVEFDSKYLFQYSNFKYFEETLKNHKLKFTSLNKFNDLYESSYMLNYFTNKNKTYKDFSRLKDGGYEFIDELQIQNIKELIDNLLDDIKVTCFSETPSESLMWSHYADKHKGICYVFEKNKIFSNEDLDFCKVKYSSKLPEIDFYEGMTTRDLLKNQLISIIETKSNRWSYENEVRFYGETKDNLLEFEPKSLKAIIMGHRYTKINEATKYVDEYNNNHNTEVKLYRSVKSPDSFNLDVYEDYPVLSDNQFKVGYYDPKNYII
ncbi:DUF2971 domain-containing protein [Zunongwangia pacifica]|uniref:DUF2971 domain-containing protein n=1 Tax=Zunongwangia pacifica TaxID=2911062 RepID=A0A9X1ZT91_9FLAO|nr:DUF2971 domain-containing protein [Zunongwangia pacifica]MCL6219594.1 DUF2971 domain-containing protein [Zunongwangia pacifica]